MYIAIEARPDQYLQTGQLGALAELGAEYCICETLVMECILCGSLRGISWGTLVRDIKYLK